MTAGQLAALCGLGAFHGINPAMGWLFAVALGLQERSRVVVLRSLPAIAGGHLASVALVAVAITVTGSVVASNALAIGGGAILVGVGLWQLLSRRHFRWVGMRLSLWQLAAWSFLMASVMGAGLMLLPVLAGHGGGHGHVPGAGGGLPDVADATLQGLAAAGVHTAAMLVTTGLIAVTVYEFVGLSILRKAWFNLDWLWAIALVGAGAATILLR